MLYIEHLRDWTELKLMFAKEYLLGFVKKKTSNNAEKYHTLYLPLWNFSKSIIICQNYSAMKIMFV